MQNDVAAFKKAIDAATSINIASHVNPDGDAIGSVLALSHALTQLGKQVTVFAHEPVPNNLRFLSGWEEIEIVPEDDAAFAIADLAIMADVSVLDRLGRARGALEAARQLVVIDHHQPSETPPGDIRVIDAEASATCLILYLVLPAIGAEITPAIAQHLLTGIATDTGSFRFQNTDPASLDAASHLVALGADLSQINEEVWEKKPISAIRLLTTALQHLELLSNGRIASSHISLGDYKTAGAMDQNSEGIVNEVGRVDSALIAVFFREPKPGKIRVSVRSRGNIDVAAVCRQFGGGGHINAAGCTFESSLEEAKRALIPALEKCLESC